jgi:hypothetical protein
MSDDEGVPLGSWGRLYAAVLLTAVVVILLSAAFSRWPF